MKLGKILIFFMIYKVKTDFGGQTVKMQITQNQRK